MGPIEMIQKKYDDLTRAEQRAADYILHDPKIILGCTLSSLAESAGTSNAAMIRMCQKIGFAGFSEFKFSLHRYLISNGADETAPEQDSIQGLLSTYIHYLSQLPAFVPVDDLQKLADWICTAKHLDIWGINRTAQSAKQLSNRLGRLGIYSKFTDDWIVMFDDAEILQQDDLCILFSMNGRGNSNYGQMLENLRDRGCNVALVTMNARLKLAQFADLVIILPWISHDTQANFFEDQIIVYMFIEMLLYEVVKRSPIMGGAGTIPESHEPR